MAKHVAVQRKLAGSRRPGTDVLHRYNSVHWIGNLGDQIGFALAGWRALGVAIALERVLDGKLIVAFIGLRHYVAVVQGERERV